MAKSNADKIRQESNLASFVHTKFKEAMVGKASKVKEWQVYMDAYNNEFFENKSKPDYKTDNVSNYIFGTIETIRPIMLDNNPSFEILAKKPEHALKSENIDFMLQCEYDRLSIKRKVRKELINTLVYGTSIYYIPYDADEKEIDVVPINIFNLYPDPLATGIDDAEYMIYADYVHENILKDMYPDKANMLNGSSINYSELVNNNDKNAVSINNQILVCEMWMHDWTSVDVEECNGKSKKKQKGIRQIVCAPELGIIFSDKMNIYEDKELPFVLHKCYDVPYKFWGDGEVKRLLSPQTQMNELTNAIIDNAKSVANTPWILDKNCGIPKGKITNRPGIILRKNPGTEISRPTPSSMPAYVQNIVQNFKYDIEQISGVYDSLKGNSEKGVYTAQGQLSLQEAGQARIRLKVKELEGALGRIGQMILSRAKQFWKEDKYVSMLGEDGVPIYSIISKEDLSYDYTITVQGSSTMLINKGGMFDLMIRLAQTTAEDGMPMVDRTAVMQYMPGHDAKAINKRMASTIEKNRQDQMNEQQHMQTHDETQKVMQDLSEQVKQLNNELMKLRQEYDKDNDEEQLEKIKEQAYTEGYNDAEGVTDLNTQLSEQNQQGLPDEIIQMIGQLDDKDMAQLLEKFPQLSEIVQQNISINKEQSGKIPT